VGDYVRPIVGDVTRLPYMDDVFDLVVMLGVTEWIPPLDTLVSEVAHVLKPGGHLIIACNNPWALQLIIKPLANFLLRGCEDPFVTCRDASGL
jgi:SAM-dependent methyltransferase